MTQTKSPTEQLERAILASLLLEPDNLADIAESIASDDFTEGPRRLTYEAMLTLHHAGTPIDLITLSEELKRVTGNAGVVGAVAKLAQETSSPSHLFHYASQLRSLLTLRSMRGTLAEAIDDLAECRPDPELVSDLLTDISLRLEGHGTRIERTQDFDLGREMARAFEDMRKEDEPPGIETGFYQLDELMHGLRPGKFIVIAGRPGMGKSAFGLTMARQMGKRGKHTLLFSMEMLRQEIVQRMLAAEADVDLSRIISRKLDQESLGDVARAIEETRGLPLTICDEPSVGTSYIRAALRRALKKGPVDCIMIDYLQIMHSGGKAESRHLEIGAYSRTLKQIAQEFEIPVIAMAQLSRAVEARDKGDRPCYPRLSDLRESGSIEQDADAVIFLWRGYVYDSEAFSEHQCEAVVAKNRGGRCGVVDLFWRGDRTRFDNTTAEPPLQLGAMSMAEPIGLSEPEPEHEPAPAATTQHELLE